MNRVVLWIGVMVIWASVFGYLFFVEKEYIQKMVWLFALVVSPILFWGIEETIHKVNMNKIDKIKEDKTEE